MKKYGSILQFIDIGSNLVDGMYSGVYNGNKKHESDLKNVLDRSWEVGVKKIIITGTSLEESQSAVNITKTNDNLFCTVGCHPTNCNEFVKSGDSVAYLNALVDTCKENKGKVVAVGEFGLDYDRLHFCDKETQNKYFEDQLIAYEELKLPLFLHCRNSVEDLLSNLKRNRERFSGGVVHSFDGSSQNAKDILDLGLYIGINGCSLKTEDNLDAVKTIPSDRILVETDSPWCEIRPTHAGAKYITTKFPSVKKEKWQPDKMVKGRNEPCTIIQVLEVLASVRGESVVDLGQVVFENTQKLFFP